MHRSWKFVVWAGMLAAASAGAQPRIFPGGVVNAAGLAPAGLPGSSIARGALVSILGAELGPGRVAVSVSDARGDVHAARVVFVSSNQINAVLPCGVAVGEARLTVTVEGRSSPPSEPFPVVHGNFQLFTRNQKGYGPAVAENLRVEGAETNSLLTPAAPGQAAALWGTGLGKCDGERDRPIQAWIGGRAAPVLAWRRAAEIPGAERLIVLIPLGAPSGCFVPVVVRAGEEYSNFASLAIGSPEGCRDKLNGFTLALPRLRERPLTWVRIQLLHGTAVTERPGIVVLQTGAEYGQAGFLRSTLGELEEADHYPALGSCLVRPLGVGHRAGTPLDAGSLVLRGPWDLTWTPDREDGLYRRRLSPTPFEDRSGDYLRPGSRYVITGGGGAQVGRFEAAVTLPRFLEWSNRDELPFVLSRDQPLVVKWSGGEAGREFVVVRGFSLDRRVNRGREFVCTARPEDRLFHLPESLRYALPATEVDFFLSVGNVPLVAWPGFQAAGLDMGFFTYETASGRNFALR